jgi:endonuclease/exonuclease/phosphatase family metal-dependent hydrolase
VPFAGDGPGAADPQVVAALVALYRELAPDVLCLQEVQAAAVAHTFGAALGLGAVYAPGGRLTQYGGAVLSRWPVQQEPPASSLGERRGASAAASDAPDVDRVSQRLRVLLPGGPALRLAHVHLPSNRQRGPEDGAARRLAEVRLVAAERRAGAGGAPPGGAGGEGKAAADVILGDFNERPDGPCARFLGACGYVEAAPAGGRADASSTLGIRRVDQVWLAPRAARALAGYVAVEAARLAGRPATKTSLSDHLPVGIDLRWPA